MTDLSAMFGAADAKQKIKQQPTVGLLEDDLAPHFHTWRAEPNPNNTGKLLQAVDPIIKSALRTYSGTSQASPTMRSKAKLLVINSLPRYDPQQAKLRTYLMTNLQSLRRATAEEEQIINVPERVRLDQQKLRTATGELSDKLGREPSDGELSKRVGLSLRRLSHIRKSSGSLAEGQMGGLDSEEGGSGSAESPAVPRGRDTYIQFVHGDLSPVDQFILEHSLGLYNKRVLSKGDIARKLGISAGAVSQRAAKIQAILDKHENMRISIL